ncbi:hypothetical protein ACS0TY_029636 [Phlomoides rotata]
MAFCGISVPSNFHHPRFLIFQNLIPPSPTTSYKPRLPFSSSTSHTSYSFYPTYSCSLKSSETIPIALRRRTISLSILGFLFSKFLFSSDALASEELELDRYTDSKEGFTLLVPSSWIKVDKAGATVLFEDASQKANNIGVVVSPTRISSLGEFGTPQFVADKLIQAERRKESTKEAEVISVSERSGHAALQVYEFEYKVDSTRGGLKRVFSAAFVSSKRLYILNISHSDGSENPLDMEKRMILEQVLHSFNAISST